MQNRKDHDVNREAKANEPTRLIDQPPTAPGPNVAPPPPVRPVVPPPPPPPAAEVIQGQNKIGVQEQTRFIGAYRGEAQPSPERSSAGRPAEAAPSTFDPVVGWLVVIAGPGRGRFRPIFEGSNPMGRSSRQRIPLDFGDDGISAEEQAHLIYDGTQRDFLVSPNLARSNLVFLNGTRVLQPTVLKGGDILAIGRTKLYFQPLCGPSFDWSEDKDKMA